MYKKYHVNDSLGVANGANVASLVASYDRRAWPRAYSTIPCPHGARCTLVAVERIGGALSRLFQHTKWQCSTAHSASQDNSAGEYIVLLTSTPTQSSKAHNQTVKTYEIILSISAVDFTNMSTLHLDSQSHLYSQSQDKRIAPWNIHLFCYFKVAKLKGEKSICVCYATSSLHENIRWSGI